MLHFEERNSWREEKMALKIIQQQALVSAGTFSEVSPTMMALPNRTVVIEPKAQQNPWTSCLFFAL